MGWEGLGGVGSTAICKDGALFCLCTVQIMGIEGNLEINSSFLTSSFSAEGTTFLLCTRRLFKIYFCLSFFADFISTCLGSLFAQNLYCINCNLHVQRHSP